MDLGLLTERERLVADLAARGWQDLAIAARLGVSRSTVKAHLGAIYDLPRSDPALNRRVVLATTWQEAMRA